MANTKLFNSVGGNKPKLNRFDLSYSHLSSMKIGMLYPVQCDEAVPGDVWKMSAFCHVEVMPMVAPLLSDLDLYAHVFFVPFRLAYGIDNSDGKSIFEKFITGGVDGDYETPLPGWEPSFTKKGFTSETVWDYIGNPVSYDSETGYWTPIVPSGLDVSIAPKLCYNMIWNEYYRDEFLQDEVDISSNEDLLTVSFRKDYFTSALENQQLGTAPALPVNLTGKIPVAFSNPYEIEGSSEIVWSTDSGNQGVILSAMNGTVKSDMDFGYLDSPAGTVDASKIDATTFTVSDLRLAFAIQRLQELNQRAGVARFTEWLGAHYGVNPTDARLDRPEYIGGCVIPINISPVVQNSSTDGTTPQGNKAGIGSANALQKLGNYRVLEPGLIMTLVSIRPKPIYQQGINRQWLRQNRFEYYSPELANLSEMGLYNAEVYVSGTSTDKDIFGYQAHWNELRCKNNMVAGALREQLSYWTMARKFGSKPALNEDFIKIVDSEFNNAFAVQDEDEFVVGWSNIIDCYRPIPALGTPGLIDHVYGGL